MKNDCGKHGTIKPLCPKMENQVKAQDKIYKS